MAFQPAESLKNRTFVGLIVAQFLAGFNDQAIHASAMFYAIHKEVLSEKGAISLMPILFYAPWAIFCTLSGYFADRYSKTYTLILWKFSEVVIALVALGGFIVGQQDPNGAWFVLAAVFLMGTHAAFFAPAKYGAMPEILQPHILSRGNGILESTTFLAAILGTVTGGLLSHLFHGREYWIGVVLVILSLIGSGASLMIAYLPPANPTRPFPKNLFAPLIANLKVLFRSRPLALAVVGIAFFIFMVAYMRQVMYMHGQTRVPRWDEFHTSLVVATVALGVGLGSPLAGFLSGGKIELGLVPLGCLGMIAASLFAAFTIQYDAALVVSLIVIGFFSGFYMVPLYTLLQHRAPKQTKGDLVATSNFINVIGAMAASVLFALLVLAAEATGWTPEVQQKDAVLVGTLRKIDMKEGRPVRLEIEEAKTGTMQQLPRVRLAPVDEVTLDEPEEGMFEMPGSGLELGSEVVVSRYFLTRTLHDGGTSKSAHYRVRAAGTAMRPAYDYAGLPFYLFLGASLMTLGILVLLVLRLPDFFVRTVFWFRALGRFHLKAFGMHHMPTSGPVILATNCANLESTLQLLTVTDRYTTFLVNGADAGGALVRMVGSGNIVLVGDSTAAQERSLRTLAQGDPVAVPVEQASASLQHLVNDLRQKNPAPVIPVFCGPVDPLSNGRHPVAIRVVFGAAIEGDLSLERLRADIERLREWAREHGDSASAHH